MVTAFSATAGSARDALYAAEGRGLWIGRPVEWPGSRPLTLEPALGPDYGGLSEWPRDQVVKVLCFCHPDDDDEMWADQEATVLRLFHAARRNRLELLLEVIPSKVGPVEADTTARIIQRFYDLGVYPDWWKLEPFKTEAAWRNAVAGDRAERPAHPRHRGARAGRAGGRARRLASSSPPAFPLVKGFAVGRTIFGQAARGLAGRRTRRRGSRRDDGARIMRGSAAFGTRPATGRGRRQHEQDDPPHGRAGHGQVALGPDDRGGRTFIEGVWAIFGHGNVAGIGEALHGIGDALPTWRGQNEQTMAHAAIAYAKTKRRKKAMAVTSSIGPGATNMVTAAALAHVNRLPVLLIPGDVFANRRPDPVLQQIEDFDDGTVSANDCFRPVARYFDRITRPEHLLTALPRALA